MFCPNCRTEYVEGIYVCNDCGAQLVLELPPEETFEDAVFVEFLYPRNKEAPPFMLVEPVLKAEGIVFYIAGEYGNIAECCPRLMVRKDQVDQVRRIIMDLETSVADGDDGEASAEE